MSEETCGRKRGRVGLVEQCQLETGHAENHAWGPETETWRDRFDRILQRPGTLWPAGYGPDGRIG